MELILHNTLRRRAEVFRPITPDSALMYVCGPTVYDRIHIGNARPLVVFDLLYRLLRRRFARARYVRNITDVDDKIIAAAQKNGVSPEEWAARYAQFFAQDAAVLNLLPPDAEPRATAHIGGMVALAQKLLDNGAAYVAHNHVLFSVAAFADYGKLANRSHDEMLAGARVEVAPYKKNPADFVLWKPAEDGAPGWDSPWGRGRPGWHLECSAMAVALLGEEIDIHGGGQDLVFPHHENEIAQSRCAFGRDCFARHWVHNGHVTLSGEKMAKSQGNALMLAGVLEEFPGEAVRYALLSSHYRRPLDWHRGLAAAAKRSLDSLYQALARGEAADEDQPPPEGVVRALHQDMNTPEAFAALHAAAAAVNRATDAAQRKQLKGRLLAGGRLMGFFAQSPEAWFHGGENAKDEEADIAALVEERNRARDGRDFARADEIRDELKARGVILEDSPGGTQWRRQ